MLKTLLILTALFSFALANSLKVSTPLEEFNTFTYKTQFDKKVKILDNIKTIVISYEKDTGRLVNKYLNTKYPPYLAKNRAVFIADIHEMPSIITSLFAMPKMRKYKHTIFIYDEDDFSEFAKPKDEKVTVVKIKDKKVDKIYYISTPQELQEAFEN